MTARFVILGNSGSGKTSLAAAIASHASIPVLDLDTVAWVPGTVALARDAEVAASDVRAFCSTHASFVIEGCYGGLIAAALHWRPRLIFLDVPYGVCESHCRSRPFEPHKYATPAAQNEKLGFLLEWARDYYTREGPMSRAEHLQLFDAYDGPKLRCVQEPALNSAGELLGDW
jgi:adenylate kinase family enzyme